MIPAQGPDFGPGGVVDVEATASPKFRLQKFLALLRKYWWVPAATTVLCVSVALVYVVMQPRTFASRAYMWETAKVRLPEGSMFSEDVQSYLGTQIELMQSTRLRDLTLVRMRAQSNSVVIPLDKDGKPLPVTIRVSASAKSTVYSILATGSHPGFVPVFLDNLMEAYREYKKNVHNEVSSETLESIRLQVENAERDRNQQQNILSDMEKTNNLAIAQEQGTVAGGYLARLKTQLSDYQLEERLLQAAAREVNSASTNKASLDLLGIGSLTGSPSTTSAENLSAYKDLEVLKAQRAKLSKYLRPKHPKISKLDADIERLEKLLEITRRQTREQLTASQATLQLKIANVKSEITNWEQTVGLENANIAEANRQKVKLVQAQSLYDRLKGLLDSVSIGRGIDQETLTILDHASPPVRSYATEESTVAMAGLGGLGLGLGFLFLLAVRDDRFASVLEITEKLGDAVVGQVPEVPDVGGKPPLLLENGDDRHMYAESYRNLRSALLFLATEGERPKVVLITSALPNEGKSTVAANLARMLAMGGSRVLLVDADLRRGVLHELLGLQREPGLAQLLRDPTQPANVLQSNSPSPSDGEKAGVSGAQLDGIMQTNSLANFHFIASGSRLSNPGDLFLGSTLDQLLARWRKEFDYVLIDSSPVFAADDAPTLAPKVDGTLFVVRSHFSGAGQVREALELLQRRQAKILGVVFNRANAASRSYQYYKYAQYYAGAEGKSRK